MLSPTGPVKDTLNDHVYNASYLWIPLTEEVIIIKSNTGNKNYWNILNEKYRELGIWNLTVYEKYNYVGLHHMIEHQWRMYLGFLFGVGRGGGVQNIFWKRGGMCMARNHMDLESEINFKLQTLDVTKMTPFSRELTISLFYEISG